VRFEKEGKNGKEIIRGKIFERAKVSREEEETVSNLRTITGLLSEI